MPDPLRPTSPNTLVAVLFDLDNTLINRSATITRFTTAWTTEFGGRLERHTDATTVAGLIEDAYTLGTQEKQTACRALRNGLHWRSRISIGDLLDFWDRVMPSVAVPVDGALDVLVELARRRFRVGVVSNGGRQTQRRKISAAGLEGAIKHAVISGEVGVRKPNRRIFDIAMHQLAASAGNTLFVGDDCFADIDGARRCGIATAWMAGGRTWPSELPAADFTLDRLEDVLTILPSSAGNS